MDKREKPEAAVKLKVAVEDVVLVKMMATEEMVGMVNALLSEAVAIVGQEEMEEEMEVIIERGYGDK